MMDKKTASGNVSVSDEKIGICNMCRAYANDVSGIHLFGKGICITFYLCRDHKKMLSDSLV